MRGIYVPWGEKCHNRPYLPEDRVVPTSSFLEGMNRAHSPLLTGQPRIINPAEIVSDETNLITASFKRGADFLALA